MANLGVVKYIFGCGAIGIVFSMILYELNSRGIIIDEFITGSITIADLMAVVIVVWLLIGVLLATLRS